MSATSPVRSPWRRVSRRYLSLALIAIAVIAAACGDDDDDGDAASGVTTSPPAAATATPASVAIDTRIESFFAVIWITSSVLSRRARPT